MRPTSLFRLFWLLTCVLLPLFVMAQHGDKRKLLTVKKVRGSPFDQEGPMAA